MELLQLIFCVIAGLSAGATGAIMVIRREQPKQDLAERLRALELQGDADRQTIQRLSDVSSAADRDLNQRLQAALAVRDEYIRAINQRLARTENAQLKTDQAFPRRRLQERINDTAGRIASVHSDVGRLEHRVQSKLITLREATQNVLRQLAESQVSEAERLSKISSVVDTIHDRIDGLERSMAEQRTGDAQELLARIDGLERGLADVSMQTQSRKATARKKPIVKPTTDLEHLFGLGPKLAKKLKTNGVEDLMALAVMTEGDLERLDKSIRGIKERAQRHGWIKEARSRLNLPEHAKDVGVRRRDSRIVERKDALSAPAATPPPATVGAWTMTPESDQVH